MGASHAEYLFGIIKPEERIMSQELYIFGTGAHAGKVFYFPSHARYAFKAFIDKNRDAHALIESLSVMSLQGKRLVQIIKSLHEGVLK